MKHSLFFISAILLFSSFQVFAQVSGVSSKIREIEDCRSEIFVLQNSETQSEDEELNQTEQPQILKNKKSAYQDELDSFKSKLNYLYADLESESYNANSKDKFYSFIILPYDKENMCWPIQLTLTLDNGKKVYEDQIKLLYSQVLKKKFVPYNQMTERQISDYEFLVDYYDNLFRVQPEILHSEISFKIQHWIKAGEYRFVPIEIKFFKTEGSTLQINSIQQENLKPQMFYINNDIEIRTLSEIAQDSLRAKNIILKEDSPNPVEEEKISYDDKKITGRKTVYISLDTLTTSLDFNEINIINSNANVYGTFTLDINNFLFWGLNFGTSINLTSLSLPDVYSLGAEFGAYTTFKNFFRPYTDLSFLFSSNADLSLGLGTGFDLFIKHFLLTVSVNYNFNTNALSLSDWSQFTDSISQSFVLKTGIGFTW